MGNFTKSILDSIIAKWLFAILTIIGTIITLYTCFVQKEAPKLEYEILSQVSVFNQYDEVSSLRIMLDTLDVQKNKANITFYTIKVINNGTMHINHNMYDTSDFGIQITNGTIVKFPVLVEASNKHIYKRFQNAKVDKKDSFILIPYLPLDINDYYILKFGVYHKESIKPQFKCEGKISGQKEINITPLSNQEYISYIKKLVGGTWHIQIIRIIIYGVIFIVLLFVIFYLFIVYIPNVKLKMRRKRFVQNVSILSNVKDDFIKYDENHIEAVYKILMLGEDKLNNNYHSSKVFVNQKTNSNNKEQYLFHKHRIDFYKDIVRTGYLIEENNKLKIDPSFMKSVKKLYNKLKTNKFI